MTDSTAITIAGISCDFTLLLLVTLSIIGLPFLAYILGKAITFGILTAKKQFKEYENGKIKKKE